MFKITHNGPRADVAKLNGLHCHSERDAFRAITQSAEYPQDYTVDEVRRVRTTPWSAEAEEEVAHSLRHANCPPANGLCVGDTCCPYS
jgi:hypothetical protein